MLQETDSDCLDPKALISSQKVDSSQESRHAFGVVQKQSSVLPQQPVDVCRGGGMSTAAVDEQHSCNKEDKAQTSADKASDHQDAVQQPPSPPNPVMCNPPEHYRKVTQRPEDVQDERSKAKKDERHGIDGKSNDPQYGSSNAAKEGNPRKQLQFTDIASISDMPIQGATKEGMACVQLYTEIEPSVDRHEQ